MANRVFYRDTFNGIYKDLAYTLLTTPEHKSRNRKGETIYELINPQFCLLKPSDCFATIRKLSLPYLNGEMDFYLSGSPYLEDIVKFSKFWSKVTDDNRTINSNYGKLLLWDRNCSNYTQFEYALSCLRENRDSKKAVMTIYDKENAFVSNDNPCTMYLHFFIRDGRLDLYVKMRSSDIWFGLPYDVPFFVLIQVLMLRKLQADYPDIRLGTYNHQSGSLHLYDRNVESLKECIDSVPYSKLNEDQYGLYREIILRRVKDVEQLEQISRL